MTGSEAERQALLDGLRRSHRVERAPAELRRRVLERLEPTVAAPRAGDASRLRPVRSAGWGGGWPLVAATGLALGALLFVLPPGDPSGLALGPEPLVEARTARLGAAPSDLRPSGEARERREPRPCPLRAVPAGAMIQPEATDEHDRRSSGYEVHTFDMQTPSCGPLTRRYVQLSPPGLPQRASAPVMVVLHDTGQSAETMRSEETRWHLDEVARRAGFILVYANAAPGPSTRVAASNSGGWATDELTHPEIEDDVYLQRIVSDLITREVIRGNNDVFLLGYGGGATMALEAVAGQPSSYAGVAALLPTNAQTIEPPAYRGPERLSRVLVVLSESQAPEQLGRPGLVPAFARRWGDALGISLPPFQRRWQLGTPGAATASVRQIDLATPASGAAAVRVLVLHGAIDPFLDPPAESRRRDPAAPPPFDGAREAWAFLSGLDGSPPSVFSSPLPAEPLFADGDSVLPDDADRYDVPSVVLEEDIVEAPRPRGR